MNFDDFTMELEEVNKKVYQFDSRYGETESVTLTMSAYVSCNPAIIMEMADGSGTYANMTVNIDPENFTSLSLDVLNKCMTDPQIVCLDTNNLGQEIYIFGIDNSIIDPEILGWVPSGFCNYPVVRITDEFYKEHQDDVLFSEELLFGEKKIFRPIVDSFVYTTDKKTTNDIDDFPIIDPTKADYTMIAADDYDEVEFQELE